MKKLSILAIAAALLVGCSAPSDSNVEAKSSLEKFYTIDLSSTVFRNELVPVVIADVDGKAETFVLHDAKIEYTTGAGYVLVEQDPLGNYTIVKTIVVHSEYRRD